MIKRDKQTGQHINLYDSAEKAEPELDTNFELYEELLEGVEQQIPLTEQSSKEKTIKQLELALWGSEQSVWMWDRTNNNVELKFYVNASFEVFERVLKFDDITVDIHPYDADAFVIDWNNHVEGHTSELRTKFRFKLKSDYVWFEIRGKVSAFDDQGALTIIGTFTNISSIVSNQTKLNLMSEAFSKSKQPMLILSQNMVITEYNEAWIQQLDPNEQSLDSVSFAELVPLNKKDMEAMQSLGYCEKNTKLTIGDQDAIPVELLINQFESTDTLSQFYIVLVKDLTDTIETEKKLHNLATIDPVSLLPNRFELLNQLTILSEGSRAFFDIYYIDLSGVKEVSDALGHQSSDELIHNIAQGLSKELDDAYIISRWGGNEFIVSLNSVENESRNALILENIARIQSAIIDNAVVKSGQHFTVSSFIGVANYPQDASTADSLIRKADAALYFSKQATHANYSIYSKGMADEILNRIELLNDLRDAINNEELNFVLQGKYDQERKLIGAELLCRWISDKHGFVSPGVFIPLIEQYGMEYQLGILAIKSAMSYLQTLNKMGTKVPISVNISATQALDPQFIDTIKTLFEHQEVDASLLELEVTESVFINDSSNANKRLDDLKAMGLRISLDDFGTGYSSLSYLGQFNFDVVKIDRSFIIEIEKDEKAKKLFCAIMNICQALDLDVVVEGIETEKQFSILHNAGVNKFQGFLLGKPSAFEDFVEQNQIH